MKKMRMMTKSTEDLPTCFVLMQPLTWESLRPVSRPPAPECRGWDIKKVYTSRTAPRSPKSAMQRRTSFGAHARIFLTAHRVIQIVNSAGRFVVDRCFDRRHVEAGGRGL